jgi:diguanylate cyclase (GGDEF)-like protein
VSAKTKQEKNKPGGLMADQEEMFKAEIESLRNRLDETRRELERRYADIEAIYTIVRKIHGALDLEELTKTVKAVLAEALGVVTYSLSIFDNGKREALFQVGENFRAETIARIITEMDEREPDWMTNQESARKVVGLKTREHAPLSFMCIPLHAQKSMAASLCAPSDELERLVSRELNIVSIIAMQIAVAIESTRLYRLTKELSITDEITGAFNFRHFQRRLNMELERSKRYQRPVSLIILGIDAFSDFEKTFGKESGEGALRDIGEVLKNNLRKVDTVARYGESEFALILPETDEGGALIVAEKTRKAISDYLFKGERERDQKLTVSLGAACYPRHVTDAADIVAKAKDALVRAKKAGKNKTVVAETEATVLAEK